MYTGADKWSRLTVLNNRPHQPYQENHAESYPELTEFTRSGDRF